MLDVQMNDGVIRYVERGFFNHLNDAQTFGFMRQIGAELETQSLFNWVIKQIKMVIK